MWFWRRLAVGMSHGCSLQDIDGLSRGYCCDGASGSTEPVGCSWCGAKRAEGSGGCGWVSTTDVSVAPILGSVERMWSVAMRGGQTKE